MKRNCENCKRFYECDNIGFHEECLPDMKFYEEAKENLKMERDNIYNISVMITNCDDVFVECGWESISEFISEINSDDFDIPMFDDPVHTLYFYGFSFNEETLKENGIYDMGDLHDWFKEII